MPNSHPLSHLRFSWFLLQLNVWNEYPRKLPQIFCFHQASGAARSLQVFCDGFNSQLGLIAFIICRVAANSKSASSLRNLRQLLLNFYILRIISAIIVYITVDFRVVTFAYFFQEIASDPQLFVGGASRFDILQGELGKKCWCYL